MPPAQVIAFAREAMREALESEGQAAEATAAGTGLKSGVTVDLSRKGIQKLPEEVVDIMKNELERYECHILIVAAKSVLTSDSVTGSLFLTINYPLCQRGFRNVRRCGI